ncbi:RecA family protein [Candidatus Methylacidithermus pantelleriae]|nr:hypothetical protein [Candidatus Methylacidithermus pantelleriae]
MALPPLPPGVHIGSQLAPPSLRWPTGIAPIDRFLRGGIPRGTLVELFFPQGGSSLWIAQLLWVLPQKGILPALVDGSFSFDPPSAFPPEHYPPFLWVQCQSLHQALQAAQELLHGGDFPLVLLDVVGNSLKELYRVSLSQWFSLAGKARKGSSTLLVFSPLPHLLPHGERYCIEASFSWEDLLKPREELWERFFCQETP